MNNVNISKISGIRKIGDENVTSMSGARLLAVAIVASVGTKASATASELQAWQLSAMQAHQICVDILPDPDNEKDWQDVTRGDTQVRVASRKVWQARETALDAARDEVIEQLRDAVLTQSIGESGLARDVRKLGELDSVQSLMARAEKRTVNYFDGRLRRGFRAGVSPNLTEVRGQGDVPESAGSFQKRTIAAELGNSKATGQTDLKGAVGIFAGNLNAVVGPKTTLETSSAIRAILNGAEEMVKLVLQGIISHDDALTYGEYLHTESLTAQDEFKAANGGALENLDDGEGATEAPERETAAA